MSTARVDSSQPTLTVPAPLDVPSISGDNAQLRKEGPDWFAIFNLNTRLSNSQSNRTLDIELVHSVKHESVVCCVRFSPDGNYFATGCDHDTHIYDVVTGERVFLFVDDSVSRSEDQYIRCLSFSPDGRYLATGAQDGIIRVWCTYTRALYKLLSGYMIEVYAVEYTPDGQLLVSGSEDNSVRVWRVDDFHNLFTIQRQAPVFMINVPTAQTNWANTTVTSIAISPNSKLIAAASLDGFVRIWEIQSQTLVAQLIGHTDSVYAIGFRRNGTELVSGSLDSTVKLWDVTPLYQPQEQRDQPCVCKYTYSGHGDYVLGVTFSHDTTHPQWVISSSKDRSVKFWDITQTETTARPEFTLNGHRNSVISVDASPAGGLFATGGGDFYAKIWRYTMLQ